MILIHERGGHEEIWHMVQAKQTASFLDGGDRGEAR